MKTNEKKIMRETSKASVASRERVGGLGNASRLDTGTMYIASVDLGCVYIERGN